MISEISLDDDLPTPPDGFVPPPADGLPLGKGRVQERFGVVTDAGFQPLPDVLLLHQAELKLKSEDLNVLLNIMAHWYLADRWPFPRPTTIAKRMGVSDRSVQRSLARLKKMGLIASARKDGNIAYDLKPLVTVLQPLAEKRVAARRRAQSVAA